MCWHVANGLNGWKQWAEADCLNFGIELRRELSVRSIDGTLFGLLVAVALLGVRVGRLRLLREIDFPGTIKVQHEPLRVERFEEGFLAIRVELFFGNGAGGEDDSDHCIAVRGRLFLRELGGFFGRIN